MYRPISEIIRNIIADMEEGDVVKKFKPAPKIKPPRREPDVKTKSNRSDYMKNYMKEYREEGKDYQKVPEKVKEYRRKQKKKKKSNIGINMNTASLTCHIGIGDPNPSPLIYGPIYPILKME